MAIPITIMQIAAIKLYGFLQMVKHKSFIDQKPVTMETGSNMAAIIFRALALALSKTAFSLCARSTLKDMVSCNFSISSFSSSI